MHGLESYSSLSQCIFLSFPLETLGDELDSRRTDVESLAKQVDDLAKMDITDPSVRDASEVIAEGYQKLLTKLKVRQRI